MNEVFYFGCIKEPGHYLWTRHGHRIHHPSHPELPEDFPVRIHILDGGLLPPCKQEIEGQAALWFTDGWTIISFWDRSVDKRGACNSSFIVRGVHTFEEAVKRAREVFPSVWRRFTFEVRRSDQ